jgi:hypothetical protein
LHGEFNIRGPVPFADAHRAASVELVYVLTRQWEETKVRVLLMYKTDCGLTSTLQPFIRAAGSIILICYSSFQQLSIVSQKRAVTSETPLVVLQLRRPSACEVQAVSSPVPVIYMLNNDNEAIRVIAEHLFGSNRKKAFEEGSRVLTQALVTILT